MELIHRTSLIFDDIQDHSAQRNGRPTLWGTSGVEQAINVGLALSCLSRLAFRRMLALDVCPDTAQEVPRIPEERFRDFCQGQFLDLAFQGRLPTIGE